MSTKLPDLNKYRNCIRQLLTEHAKFVSSNDDIVVGFHPPYIRKLTDYAVS